MSFTTSILKRQIDTQVGHSCKSAKSCLKDNTRECSQLYLRQTTTNFQLIVDNIPVVVSNSCLKKKIQELISDADKKLPSMSLASERIEDRVKANPNEEEDFNKRDILSIAVGCWLLKVHTRTHAHTHTQPCTHAHVCMHACSQPLFPIKLQINEIMLFKNLYVIRSTALGCLFICLCSG